MMHRLLSWAALRTRRALFLLVVATALLGAGGLAQAQTEVPADWPLIPSSLGAGDQFRLLIVTSTTRSATSADIGDYDTHVQSAVAAGHASIRSYSSQFKVLGSTPTVDARDHTGTTGTGVPIYWLGGAKVADDYADFYDDSWDSLEPKTERGANAGAVTVWTGSKANGTRDSAALGGAGATVMSGGPTIQGLQLDAFAYNKRNGLVAANAPFYGLSPVFQVAGSTNAAPAFAADAATGQSVAENTAAGMDIGSPYTATDADTDDTLTYTLEGTDAASFEIDASSGQLKTKAALDHETKPSYAVTVKVSDGTDSATIAVTITVTDVAEAPEAPGVPTVTATSGVPTSLDVSWTAPANTGPAITDYDVQYRAGSSGGFTPWAHSGTGTSTTITGVDASTAYQVQVRATNAEGTGDWSASGAVPRLVLDRTALTLTEGVTGTYELSLAGVPKNKVTVDITKSGDTGDRGIFLKPTTVAFTTASSSAQTVKVQWRHDADAENETFTLTHTVKADSDAEYRSLAPVTVVVTVLDDEALDNTAPVFSAAALAATMQDVPENTAAGTGIGPPYTATDADTGDTLTYTLEGADASAFEIDASSGQLTTKAALDHETKPSYVVTVKVSDGTDSATIAVTITVADVDEKPGKPDAPTVAASAGSATSLDVSWQAPANTGPAIRSYDLRYKKSADATWTDGPQDVAGKTATIDTGLEASTAYQVQVRATSDEGDGVWSASGAGTTGATVSGDPAVTIAAADDAVSEADDEVVFTLTRTGATTAKLTVKVRVTEEGDVLANAADYANPVDVEFGIGEDTAKLPVLLDDDSAYDPDLADPTKRVGGRVTAAVQAGTGYVPGAVSSVTVDVTDDEDSPLTATLTLDPASPVAESVGTVTVVLTVETAAGGRQPRKTYASTISSRSETASSAEGDFEVLTAQVLVPPSEFALDQTVWRATERFTITIHNDDVDEDNETFRVITETPPPSDRSNLPATDTLTVTIVDDDTRGVTVDPRALAVTEGAAEGATYTVVLTSEPTDTVTVRVRPTADAAVTPQTLEFTAADWSTEQTVTVTAVDDARVEEPETVMLTHTVSGGDYEGETAASVAVTVTDNDVAGLEVAPAALTVAEGATAGGTYTVVLTSQPTGGTVTVTVSGQSGTDLTVSPERLTFNSFIWNAEQTVTVKAGQDVDTDDERVTLTHTPTGGGYDDVAAVTVTVTVDDDDTANAAPVFSAAALAATTQSVAENTAAGMDIGSPYTATDADTGDTLTYTLEGTDAGSFEIDASSGQLKTRAALDHEATPSYVVTVKVSDGTDSATIEVTITVTDVDEAPEAPAAPTVTASAGSPTSLEVSWTAPVNTGRPAIGSYDLRYKKSADATWTDGPQDVAGTSATMDTGLEAGTAYQVQVRATNDEGDSEWSASGAGTTASPDNTAPVFSAAALAATTQSVAENTAAGMDIGSPYTATDADTGDTLTYTLEGADASSFEIDASTGQLKTKAALDHEAKPSYAVTVKVSDGALSATIAVTVTVTDVDEAPDAPAAPTVAASAGSTTSLGVSWTAPVNTGRPAIGSYDLRYKKSADATWTDGPQDVTGTSTTMDTGLEAGTAYQVQVRATNDEGDSDWSASGVGTTASPANAAPAFSAAALAATEQSVPENTAAGMDIGSPYTATDADTGDTLTYSLEGADAGSFEIDASTGQLKTRAALDHEAKPSYAVTVKVSDGALSATIAVTVTVTDVDEAPEAPAAPTVTASAGSPTSLEVSWTAPVNTGRPAIGSYDLRYKKSADATWTDGPQDVAGTSATMDTGLEAGTAYQVQVRATNDEGDSDWSASGAGTTASPDNTAPVFSAAALAATTQSVAENTAAGMDIGSPYTATDADTGDTLTYTLEGADASSFEIDASTGQLKTKAALDHEAKPSYAVTVKVSDGALSATIAVTVTVTDVDEAPDAPAAPTVAASAGSTTSLGVSWTAPVNTGRPAIGSYDLRYKKSADATWTDGPQDVTGTSTTMDTGLEAGTAYQVQVRATNDEGDSDWSASGVGTTASPANAAPAFSVAALAATEQSVPENTAAGMDIGSPYTATDADTGDTLTYSLEGADASAFEIDASSGQLTTKAALDHETKPSYAVTVKVSDGTDSATIEVTVTVTDVEEKPGKPDAPTVTASAGSATSLDVSWQAPANTGPAIQSYDLRYKKSADATWIDGPQDQAGRSAAITGLDAGTAYAVQVRATSDEGDSEWSASGAGTTTADVSGGPGAPRGLEAVAGDREVALSWKAPAHRGASAIVGYEVRRRALAGGQFTAWARVEGGGGARGYTATGLGNGTEYEFEVRAVNGEGAGAVSAPARARPAGRRRRRGTSGRTRRGAAASWRYAGGRRPGTGPIC